MQAVVLVEAAAAGTPKLWGMKKNGLHFSLSRFLHLLLFSSRIFPVRLCEINAHISVLFQTDTIRNPTIFHRSGGGAKARAAACHIFFLSGTLHINVFYPFFIRSKVKVVLTFTSQQLCSLLRSLSDCWLWALISWSSTVSTCCQWIIWTTFARF